MVSKDGPVTCLAYSQGNKATTLLGITAGGTLLVFNPDTGILNSTYGAFISETTSVCTLEGHGLYFFVYLASKNQVVKYSINGGPSVSSVMQLTARDNYTSLMYNSLGDGYLFSPSRIVPLNFFRGRSGEVNTTLMPQGSTNAAIDLYAGYRGGGDSNIWVSGARFIVVFSCKTDASVPSAPQISTKFNTGAFGVLDGPFAIDYVNRKAYVYNLLTLSIDEFSIGNSSAPVFQFSGRRFQPLQRLRFAPILLPPEIGAMFLICVVPPKSNSPPTIFLLNLTSGLSSSFDIPLSSVSSVTVSGPKSVLLCGSNSTQQNLAFCVTFHVDG